MVQQTSNRHIHAVVNNFKFIILDYLAAKQGPSLLTNFGGDKPLLFAFR